MPSPKYSSGTPIGTISSSHSDSTSHSRGSSSSWIGAQRPSPRRPQKACAPAPPAGQPQRQPHRLQQPQHRAVGHRLLHVGEAGPRPAQQRPEAGPHAPQGPAAAAGRSPSRAPSVGHSTGSALHSTPPSASSGARGRGARRPPAAEPPVWARARACARTMTGSGSRRRSLPESPAYARRPRTRFLAAHGGRHRLSLSGAAGRVGTAPARAVDMRPPSTLGACSAAPACRSPPERRASRLFAVPRAACRKGELVADMDYDDPKKALAEMDDAKRDAWLMPDKVVRSLGSPARTPSSPTSAPARATSRAASPARSRRGRLRRRRRRRVPRLHRAEPRVVGHPEHRAAPRLLRRPRPARDAASTYVFVSNTYPYLRSRVAYFKQGRRGAQARRSARRHQLQARRRRARQHRPRAAVSHPREAVIVRAAAGRLRRWSARRPSSPTSTSSCSSRPPSPDLRRP
jgi:hypothetical protein